ncbi:hypothetical protein SAY87_013080 [Trapa incisa]|uniref:Uncharacterized protein n=1 Tax=Trapa incisa TaxID=236973 RepID=A0AAN7KHD3_9MYRT|nr:hypothetical protein SAY87_013080 [Trapa incisa]
MESLPDQKMDLINTAIQRLIDEKKSGHGNDPFIGVESEDHRLLSELLFQLESLRGDAAATNPPTSSVGSAVDTNMESSGEKPEVARSVEMDEISKEIKELKKQNRITHWLLFIMLVITVTWQVSEVSLLLMLKDGISHPFRSVGGMLTGMFKRRKDRDESHGPSASEMLPIPPVMIPELPTIDVTDLGFKSE